MNIWLTFDYELFFGSPTGSPEKCILEPTDRLIDLCKRFNIAMTFFVDAGYLFKLKELSNDFPELGKTHDLISKQLKELLSIGCDIQLHIHPHWELSTYAHGAWTVPTDRGYRMADFSDLEALAIFKKYKYHLDSLIGRDTMAFRAGGWCIQPFSKFKNAFQETGILYDSSVVAGKIYHGGVYDIDFSRAPKDLDGWSFENDPCFPEKSGRFTEIPIATHHYKPFFYWSLYVLGKLNKDRHKFVGDGNYIAQPGQKWQSLTRSQFNHVSCDGYYVSVLEKITKKLENSKKKNLVIIGHPKSMTEYSFEKLDAFLAINHKKYCFQTFEKYHAASR